MISYADFCENCKSIEARIAASCQVAGRSVDSVSLLPVTKTHPFAAVDYAQRYGFSRVGENKVQEAMEKQATGEHSVSWELIGHLQSNKAKFAVKHFERVQTVDSEKILNRLNRAAQEAGKKLAVLLQVNAGDDPAKYGVTCEASPRLLEQALEAEYLQVDGLMTIAPFSDDKSVAQRTFNCLRETRDTLADQFSIELAELSMGMTGDLEAAIEAGSTQIRVGTALFGARR